jgi:hypothetical protein
LICFLTRILFHHPLVQTTAEEYDQATLKFSGARKQAAFQTRVYSRKPLSSYTIDLFPALPHPGGEFRTQKFPQQICFQPAMRRQGT